jgi:hypothetical protein
MDLVEPVLLGAQALQYYHGSEVLIKPHFRHNAISLDRIICKIFSFSWGEGDAKCTRIA